MRRICLAVLATLMPLSSASAQGDGAKAAAVPSVAFTALEVVDLDRSLAFYREVFGMTEKLRVEAGDVIEVGIDFPQASASPRILLVRHKGQVPHASSSAFNRIALLVPEIGRLCDAAVTKGGRVIKPVSDLRAHRTKIAFIADPDGNVLELLEPY